MPEKYMPLFTDICPNMTMSMQILTYKFVCVGRDHDFYGIYNH